MTGSDGTGMDGAADGQRLRHRAHRRARPGARAPGAAPRRGARRRVPAVLRDPGPVRPRRGRLPVRPGRHRVPGRVQQRAVGRPLAPPRHRGGQPRQLQTLNTHTRYLTAGVVDYAERLLATHQLGPAHAMFTCTGSEANDLALRIARHHTGGTGVIVTANAYHGVTAAPSPRSPPASAFRSARTSAPSRRRPDGLRRRRGGGDRRPGAARRAARRVPRRLAVVLRRRAARPGRLPRSRSRTWCARRAGCTSPTRCSPGSAAPAAHLWGYQRQRPRPGHRDDGQADGQRAAHRRDLVARRGCWRTSGGGAVLQHLRRQPGLRGRRGGRARRARRRGPARQRRRRPAATSRARAPAWRRRASRLGDVRGAGLYLGVDVVTGAPAPPRPSWPPPSSTACATAGF